LNSGAIYLRPGVTDMRKSINGLCGIVQTCLKRNPLDGDLFLFCNRGKYILKILYWQRNGFCLWQKRLERHRFPWPNAGEERTLNKQELEWLLSGVDFFHAHEEIHFKAAV